MKLLGKLNGQHVTAGIVGTISTQNYFDSLECWEEPERIVLSDEDEEKYIYIRIDKIEDLDCIELGELIQLDIMLEGGVRVQVYN